MKKRTKIVIIASIVGGLALAGLVGACAQKYRTPEGRAEYIVKKVTRKLDLNEAQVEKLNSVKETAFALHQEMRAKHPDPHKDIAALLEKPTLDRQRVLALVRERTQFFEAKAPQMIGVVADFFDSLTPEQQQKLREHLQKHSGHKWGHHGGHRAYGHGESS